MPEDGPAAPSATDDEGAHGRLEEALASRRQKAERLRERGVEPFALSFDVTAHAADLHARHAGLAAGARTDDEVAVAGRVMLARRFGKLVFLTVRDRTGDIQLFCSRETMDDDGFALLDDIDLGDIVGARGSLMTTTKGELSIEVERLTLLTKALRPLPEKWHGLKDPDTQQRQRYLHLATDLGARSYVDARARALRAIRSYLDERGYVEVETPVLQPVAGGALAQPFVTHHNALDIDLYLRISLELYLKRLLVGGMERVYEIGRNFRNEGIDRTHNPEFTMLELYQAYADYFVIMDIVEDLVRGSALAVTGGTTVRFRGQEFDLSVPWRRITVLGSVSEAVGEEVTLDRRDLPAIAERRGIGLDPRWGPGAIVKELYEKLVEPTLLEPTFVMDFPREVSPLARPHRSDPSLTEHVDPVIGGIEIGTGYSELTDPVEQRAKFELQLEAKRAGDEEAHPFDEDFVEALEHGMPPAGGLGLGIDRLLMVLTDAPSIRDLILFPHHRPEA